METRRERKSLSNVFEFKSYYVVWKLFPNKNRKYKQRGFKSYYVVWKPMVRDERTQIIGCLNRTM